ncbi:MAG: response regulator [Eisenbergiella massiliensis]
MRRILLVEDEKMIRYGIYVMIENSGVPYSEITECRNGRDAVECLKKDRYDLVLTDIKMPVMAAGAFKVDMEIWKRKNGPS